MSASRPGDPLAPDLVQPVIGYRLWRLGQDDALYSPYVEERWARLISTWRGSETEPTPAGRDAWAEPA